MQPLRRHTQTLKGRGDVAMEEREAEELEVLGAGSGHSEVLCDRRHAETAILHVWISIEWMKRATEA